MKFAIILVFFLQSAAIAAAGGSAGGVGLVADLREATLFEGMLTVEESVMDTLEQTRALEEFLTVSTVIDPETGLRVAVVKNIETEKYSVVKEVK